MCLSCLLQPSVGSERPAPLAGGLSSDQLSDDDDEYNHRVTYFTIPMSIKTADEAISDISVNVTAL